MKVSKPCLFLIKFQLQILEVDPKATNDEIKKAYRKMVKKYHPDKVIHLEKNTKKGLRRIDRFKKLMSNFRAKGVIKKAVLKTAFFIGIYKAYF